MRKAFDWERSEVLIGLSIVLCIVRSRTKATGLVYMRSVLFVESFDLHPSNQYILVRVIPSCFRFARIRVCLCQVSLLSRHKHLVRYILLGNEFLWNEASALSGQGHGLSY
jgi:hypothetical protein